MPRSLLHEDFYSGAVPPDMNMAAIITSAFAITTSATIETALAIAMPIAVLGQFHG